MLFLILHHSLHCDIFFKDLNFILFQLLSTLILFLNHENARNAVQNNPNVLKFSRDRMPPTAQLHSPHAAPACMYLLYCFIYIYFVNCGINKPLNVWTG